MKLHQQTWFTIAAAVIICCLLNLICWQPGQGSATGGRPPCFDLELYFGWPAQYQADHWRSEDIERFRRPRGLFPFANRRHDMTLLARYVGWIAIVIDVAFAIGVIVVAGIASEVDKTGHYNKYTLVVISTLLITLGLLYLAADHVAVHL